MIDYSKRNRELYLEAIANRPVPYLRHVLPLEGDAATPDLAGDLRPDGEHMAAVPAQKTAAVNLVVGGLLEQITDHANLEGAERWNRSIAYRIVDVDLVARRVVRRPVL